MKEPTNAELAFRIKQLEDRLRVARVDVDRMQGEVEELRRLLSDRGQSAGQTPPPKKASEPGQVAAAEKAPADTTIVKRPQPVREERVPQPAAQQVDRAAKTEPAGSSLIAQGVAWLRARVGDIPLEEFVGLNLLNKIGVLMLVVGAGFFLRIAYQSVGPELKLAGLTLLAAGALFAGEYFFRKRHGATGEHGNYRLFGMGLAAGGSVLLFFNAFAAYHVDATRVIPESQSAFAYLLLLLVAGGIVANSLRYNSEAFTGFAYLLAFISISINESEASAERFTGHFALLALAILAASLIIVMSLRRWKFLGVLGLVGTYANFFWYTTALPRTLEGYVWRGEALAEFQNFVGAAGGPGPDYFLFAFLYLAIYWLVFSVSLFTMPAASTAERRIASWLHVANVICFYSLVAYIRPPAMAWGSFAVTAGLGSASLLIGILGRSLDRGHLWKPGVILGLALLTLALPFRFSEHALVFGWLVMATAAIALGYSLREGLFRYAGYLIILLNIGAFLDLPAGDLFYGYGPEALQDAPFDDQATEEPGIGQDESGQGVTRGLPEAGAPLWAFDWNRGLLYVFMLVCFFGLQVFAALVSRQRPGDSEDIDAASAGSALPVRTQVDHLAWHVLGGMGVLVAVLLAHYSLLLGQQALALVPFAGLLLLAHRLLRIAPFYLYVVLLLWAALLSAGGLIVANEGPGESFYQRASLLSIFAGGVFAFFYHHFFAPDLPRTGERRFAWRMSSPASPALLAGIALWTPAIIAPSFAAYQLDERLTILGATVAAAGLAAVYWRFRQGLLALAGLSSFSVLFVLVLYLIQFFDAENLESRSVFLYNSGWLWLAATAGAVAIHLGLLRSAGIAAAADAVDDPGSSGSAARSGFAFAALLAVGALVAVAWIQIQVNETYAVYRPLAILLYAFVLAVGLRWRVEFSGRALPVALAGLALLVGPLVWTLEYGAWNALDGGVIGALFTGETYMRYLQALLAVGALPAFAILIAVCVHPAKGARDLAGLFTLLFALALVHLLVPQIYRPSAYGLITLSGYYLLDRLRAQLGGGVARSGDEWSRLFRLAPFAFICTLLSFAALLFDYSAASGLDVEKAAAPLALRAIMGVVPLIFLSFSLALHGKLFGEEELTPFQRGGYPALLLAFVLLTMSLVNVGWWSLVWAVLGVAALVGGILRNLKLLRYGGFALILLALLKLSLWDIRELESTARVVVLVCVGVSLVVASYFYARFKDLLFPKE